MRIKEAWYDSPPAQINSLRAGTKGHCLSNIHDAAVLYGKN